MPNFNFLALLVSKIVGVTTHNIKSGAADLPRRPLPDFFLHGAIVSANAYQLTKFQIPSSISFGDMEGVSK